MFQHRRSRGGLDPKPHGGGAGFKLSVGDRIRLLDLPRRRSDATLQQLKGMWPKLKARLRRAAARTTPALDQAIAEALDHLTNHDIHGWIQHSSLYATGGSKPR